MFNERIELDDMTEDSLLLATIRMNIEFALVSVRSIIRYTEYDRTAYGNDYIYHFFHVQSLLTACGNITSAFFTPRPFFSINRATGHYDSRLYRQNEDAARSFRNRFGVTRERFNLVFRKEMRNTVIHSNERIVEHNGRLGDFNIIDQSTPDTEIWEILHEPHLRTIDLRNMTFYTYDRQRRQIEVNLFELERQLVDLQNAMGRAF